MSSQIAMDLGGLLPIGEKRKLLNQFILKVEENQVNNILESSKILPTSQYNLLKLLLADKFHRIDLIVELLFAGDPSIVDAATTKRWLYDTENSVFADDEFLMNKLFPNVSYNCRQKILYRLGRHMPNEEKADRIWNVVEQKYGFHVAFPLLQACSKGKIDSLITNRKVDLSGYQLVQILKKFPDIGLQYIKKHFPNLGTSSTNSYRSPLVYLYEHHPDDFLDLCINHSDKIRSFKIGRSRSTKMIRSYRAKLLEKPSAASSLLKLDRIQREFSMDEFQTFFESSFTTQQPTSMSKVWTWVDRVPICKRVPMINDAFMKLYQVNIDENFELMDPQYIILLPEQKRLSAIEWKSEKDQNYGWSYKNVYAHYYRDDDKKRAWLPLKPSSHSVPELQKLLLIEQDVAKRATLSKYLLETCYINGDLPRLLNVLQLLNKRARNDQSEVRTTIFQSLDSVMNKMVFPKEHWDIIVEMIQVSLVFSDSRDYSDNNKEKLLEKCIAFHLKSKLPLNSFVSMYIKLKVKIGSTNWTNDYVKNEADKRSFLVACAKELENLQLNNDLRSHDGKVLEAENLSEFIGNLIEEISKFNKSSARISKNVEPISFASNQWLRTSLETIAKEEEDRINKKSNLYTSSHSWTFAKQLVNIIQALRKEENLSLDAFNDSENLFSKILHTSPCSSIVTYFLAKNPSHLVDNWPTTLSKMLKSESVRTLMKNLRLWNYSSLTVPAIKICSEILEQPLDHDSEVTIRQKFHAVSVLSVLSEPVDFLLLAEKFYPVEKKVDVFADNSKEDYEIRQAITKCLVNVNVSHITFPAVEKFCVGDYLKHAIAALYSHAGRASEIQTLNFLRQKLNNSPVSLQKHIIRLYYVIASVEDRINAFKQIESENVTIRYEMFCRANKLFRSSPSQQTWIILKNIIDKTTDEDASIILHLHSKPKLDNVPVEHLSDYIITSLTILRNVKPDYVADFMRHLENIMVEIPEKILDEIILNKCDEQTDFSSSFGGKYIHGAATESILEHRLSNMWLLLKNVIRNGWDLKTPRQYDPNSFDYPTRTSVIEFVKNLSHTQMDDVSKMWLKRKSLQTILEKFRTESMIKFFQETLHLELGLLLLNVGEKCGSERLKPFGESVARLVDSLVGTYGGEIVMILKDVIDNFVESCHVDEFDKSSGSIVESIEGILETSQSRANQIISICLLKGVNPKSTKLVGILEKINNILDQSTDVVAQMYRRFSTS